MGDPTSWTSAGDASTSNNEESSSVSEIRASLTEALDGAKTRKNEFVKVAQDVQASETKLEAQAMAISKQVSCLYSPLMRF